LAAAANHDEEATMTITALPNRTDDDDDGGRDTTSYRRRLGQRIRQIRQQRGLSLHEVEARTGEEFKSSVLGAYERGERSVSVGRLMRLAAFYEVPVDQMLPGPGADASPGPAQERPPLRIDLTRVARLGGVEGEFLRRQLGLLQLRRQDFNGRVMTLRFDDQRMMAGIFNVREERIRSHLESLELLAGS
jgi:transcriptional regulator with XRE-family HTH domain